MELELQPRQLQTFGLDLQTYIDMPRLSLKHLATRRSLCFRPQNLNLVLMTPFLDMFFSALWLTVIGVLESLSGSSEPPRVQRTSSRGNKVTILVSLESGIVSKTLTGNSQFLQ